MKKFKIGNEKTNSEETIRTVEIAITALLVLILNKSGLMKSKTNKSKYVKARTLRLNMYPPLRKIFRINSLELNSQEISQWNEDSQIELHESV